MVSITVGEPNVRLGDAYGTQDTLNALYGRFSFEESQV